MSEAIKILEETDEVLEKDRFCVFWYHYIDFKKEIGIYIFGLLVMTFLITLKKMISRYVNL